ncbi:MAG: hypothetical protein H6658_06645 [Ardenticatenaceae bacterium]|nr:hypothetical protein [Ardenticatenaceae bacterium]
MKKESRMQSSVWGGLLILFGVIGLVEMYTNLTVWVWAAVLAVAGLAIFGVYLRQRSEWGLLVPAYVLLAVAALLTFIELNVLEGSFVATFVLTAVALPFIIAFLLNRQQWALLIPAYVLLAVGIMVSLIEREMLTDLMIPAYVMFAIALPFFVVFGRNPHNWWALIPGGITAVIGLSFLVAEALTGYIMPIALILAGVAILINQFARRQAPPKLPK